MAQAIIQVLTSLMQDVKALNETRGFAGFEPDEHWPSPCEFEQDGHWQWQPKRQSENGLDNDFSNVGQALNIKVDQQYEAYFTCFFSQNIQGKHADGELELLFPWSQDDFTRLQQNLIGHLMMKQRLKQVPTLFFAVTDEEDMNLVVNNVTGEVCLEYVGKEPHKVISSDLVTFLTEIKPS